MRQGEIWYADLNPTEGSEQAGKRPVVIVSGDTLNDALPIIIIVPLTSKIKSYPTCVFISPNRSNGLKKNAEAIPFQIRTIAKKRLMKRIGQITSSELREVIKGLFVSLTH